MSTLSSETHSTISGYTGTKPKTVDTARARPTVVLRPFLLRARHSRPFFMSGNSGVPECPGVLPV